MSLPQVPPPWDELVGEVAADAARFHRVIEAELLPTVAGRYLHWESLRRRTPPDELTHRDWWFGIKLARRPLLRRLPLRDTNGDPFELAMPDPLLEMLHHVDQQASGRIELPEEVTNPATRDRYLVNSLIEEAITSSQLEGANTTRRVAKEMLRTGRPPRTRDERMIFNNFRAMNAVRDWQGEPMTVDRILELHRIVTEGTLDDPGAAGRFQHVGDERMVVVGPDREVVFTPPPAEQLEERAAAMVAYANGVGDDSPGFTHPVIRAVLLHFWLAHDHPFEDGNGRTARALFYWAMLRSGYWLTEFLSISRILRVGAMRYARSFLYTESDDRDTTYFALHQLSVIVRAIADLETYLQRKIRETRDLDRRLRTLGLNHRQEALIGHALRHGNSSYTFRSHQRSHGVVYQSARSDLLDLERRGFVLRRKVGRAYEFSPIPNLSETLQAAMAELASR